MRELISFGSIYPGYIQHNMINCGGLSEEKFEVSSHQLGTEIKSKAIDVSSRDSKSTCQMPDIPDKLFNLEFTSVSDILIFD